MRRAALAAVVFLATFVGLAFLALPVCSIFLRVSPGRLAAQLGNPVVTDALIVSLKTTVAAQALILAFGTPTAYVLASRRFRGRSLLVTLVELPLVLPPAVAGIGLFAAFGRSGLLHTSIPFTQAAVVLAVAFVASPLYVRAAIAAFEGVDPNVVAASRTLGAGPLRTFFRVVLPLARGGLAAGAALAFARGLGEFGATIMFAGSLRWRHRDAAARRLLAVQRRLQRRPRRQRAARADQRRPPRHAQMASLRVDFTLPLRDFELTLALDVARTVALVGPSGAGKTSALRVVAGLARPQRGRVELGGETWLDTERGIDLRPEERRVGLVFQEYALFPHMSVRANVAYGGRERVDELLERFHIAHLAEARPGRLSGGERQRVALARALARDPDVLLLDEPLSALDAHTKTQVRGELSELLRGLDLPTLLVTHDYEDAAALADKVGVVVDGQLRQLAAPAELVARPRDAFVASFTGANLLHGTAHAGGADLTEVRLPDGTRLFSTDPGDGEVGAVVYPWEISVARTHADDSALNVVRGEIGSLVEVGNRVRVRIGPVTAEITASSAARLELERGGVAYATFKATGTRLVSL